MGIGYYVALLLVVAVMNWTGRRYGSRAANKLIFVATAGSPIILSVGLMAVLLVRDGASIFADPYLPTLLLVVGACTILTCLAALIGQVLGRPKA